MSPEEVVDTFIGCWNKMDVDGVTALMADDIEYENVGMNILEGRDAARAFIESFVGMSDGIRFEVHHQIASGDLVMNERTDNFDLSDGKKMAIRLMGIFRVSDGKITHWRDYFDLNTLTQQMS